MNPIIYKSCDRRSENGSAPTHNSCNCKTTFMPLHFITYFIFDLDFLF